MAPDKWSKPTLQGHLIKRSTRVAILGATIVALTRQSAPISIKSVLLRQRGNAFSLAGASIAGTSPCAGVTPQRPESESADGFSVTG
jgi:hypothetical protein